MTTRRSMLSRWLSMAAVSIGLGTSALAQTAAQVVDLASRPGVTQRFLYLAPAQPKAAVVLYAGGHGGLGITPEGEFRWGAGNFLVRSRHRFAKHGLAVAVIDAPSDRQDVAGFRQRDEHVSDAKAVIAWLREHTRLPVWLIGTSRGTQSVAFIATQARAGEGGPDGIVLTASVLVDPRGRPVPLMALDRIGVPVLVVHHEQDGCRACPYSDVPWLMGKLAHLQRKEMMAFAGGISHGDPCEARAHHGFNGIEDDVVARIAAWITAR
jgi:dienelactone hydrolase